jgi:hypothetical protein
MRKAWLLALTVLVISSTAFAGDPPARVARLSYMSGEVSVQPGGVDDWVQANINRPLTSTDRVWADNDARAELQLGGAALRLNENTSLTLANVSDNNVQLQLDQGVASLHVVELFNGEVYEVDTPNVSFIVRKSGDYRFDVDNAADTTAVTVFRGEGDATGDGPAVRVKSEERYMFSDGRSMRYAINHNPGLDGFDEWALARAQREDKAVAARYVSRYAVGYSDLDDYGNWETVATYGPVWYPRTVVVGWAPYRYGHWVYVGPWGWTWVDDAPWGFAPFHYGRWVYSGSRWGWCPGPIRVRPVYAPALVAWVGGPHFGVSVGIGGGVGWFPLGWGEPYIPYYRHSRGYFEHVNVTNTRITNITYITNNYYGDHHGREWNYAYRGRTNAVTAVSNDDFRTSRPTRGHFIPLHDGDLHDAHVERNIPIRPTTNSVLGANAGQHSARPPATWAHPSGRDRGPVANGDRRPDAKPHRDGEDHDRVAGRDEHQDRDNGRPQRNIPRPPERGNTNAPATAEVERPRDIPNPGRDANRRDDDSHSMPARVPRPDRDDHQQGNGRPDHEIASKPTDAVRPAPSNDGRSRTYAPEHDNRQVPRPQDGQVDRPDRHVNADGRDGREQAPRVTETHNVPRPESRPMPAPAARNEGVSRDMRPQAPLAREERPAARAEQPARSAEPAHAAPAPARSAEPQHAAPAPARENKPVPPAVERKIDRLNDNPRSDVRYLRPYGTVREASYTSVARPTNASRMESDYPRSNDGRTSVNTHTSAKTSDVWGPPRTAPDRTLPLTAPAPNLNLRECRSPRGRTLVLLLECRGGVRIQHHRT